MSGVTTQKNPSDGEFVGGVMPWLEDGIVAAAPKADVNVWVPALTPWLIKSDISTPMRVAAFLGQCSVEVGPGFSELKEDLYYTHASRLCAVYPHEFPTLQAAAPYVANPMKLANRVYANRCGNGDEASGQGAQFVGRGLLQITGAEDYIPFAAWAGKSVSDASDWAETPDGAAASACWYWTAHKLNGLADQWEISKITRAVNGAGMEGNVQRVKASNLAYAAITAT